MTTLANQIDPRAPVSDRIAPAAWFALAVLVLANLLNYLDRQIVAILAQAIKADLGLDDAQLGFLLGTAFAVFYSVVGIAMGGIADRLPRRKVMAFGLVLWSAMTALGASATSFATLSIARIGVGVGEAAANPCSNSLLADIFPPRRRALALSMSLAGVLTGSALALILGGWFLDHWAVACERLPFPWACALAPWKAALLAVGSPGLVVALLLLTIHEPHRVQRDTASAGALVVREFAAALPPFTVYTAYRFGGARGLRNNLLLAVGIALVAGALIHLTDDVAQWAAFGLGAYSVATWTQIQSLRDRPLFRLTFGDRTFACGVAAAALITCVGSAVSAWAPAYAMRTFALSSTSIGLSLGLIYSVGGVTGVIAGGWLTDHWKRYDARAPLWVCAISLASSCLFIPAMLLAQQVNGFLIWYGLLSAFGVLWSGGMTAMIQDLVLPRMRGSAAACYSLVSIVVAAGTGPYGAGKISTVTGSLALGMASPLLLAPIALLLLWLTSRRLPFESPDVRLARAVAAGERTE